MRPVSLIEQVLPRAVGGDGHGVAEQHGAGVGGEVRMRVEVVGDCDRFGTHRVPIVAAIGVELEMGHVGRDAFEMLHGLQRGREVARGTRGCCNAGASGAAGRGRRTIWARLRDDLAGRELAVAFDGDVECLASLPHFQAATPPGLTALTP